MRENYVDIAKGIAMLLVVRIHTEIFGDIGVPYPVIAVPLFFFLSGFYDRTDRPIKQWVKKDFCSLVGTSIVWGVITFLFISLLQYIKTKDMSEISNPISWDHPLIGMGVTWFLVALFYAKLFTYVLSKVHASIIAKAIFVIVIGAAVSRVNLPFLLDEGLSALPFYYIGKIVHPHMDMLLSKKSLILGGAICFCFMPCHWFPWAVVNMSSDYHWELYPVFFSMILMSFMTFLWICRKMESLQWYWIERYGRQTLGILVIHPILSHTAAVILKRIFEPMSTTYVTAFLLAYVAICITSYYISVFISRNLPYLFGILPQRKMSRDNARGNVRGQVSGTKV